MATLTSRPGAPATSSTPRRTGLLIVVAGLHVAIIYGLIETCKLNNIDPRTYLQYVLERIAEHPINKVDELLPWNVADKLNQPDQVTKALAA